MAGESDGECDMPTPDDDRQNLNSNRPLPVTPDSPSPAPDSLPFAALLFDLDGVLVDSRGVVERVWRRWAALRGRDPEPFIRVAHGRRISETIREVAPELDARSEAAILDAMEAVATEGLAALPGAPALIASLDGHRWAVVTSGGREVATLRLRTAGIEPPGVFITAEDVKRGKPDPEGYLTAARRLGTEPGRCIVLEDAPPGIRAARAAGMRVVATATTHGRDALAEADMVVESLAQLEVGPEGLMIRAKPGREVRSET